jgi:hypothetical protein
MEVVEDFQASQNILQVNWGLEGRFKTCYCPEFGVEGQQESEVCPSPKVMKKCQGGQKFLNE